MNDMEFAWRLYESERDFIKHHENQRTNASSILAAISAAIIVAYSTGVAEGILSTLLAFSLFLTGLFGTIFSGKLYELIQLHASRSYEYLEIMQKEVSSVPVNSIKENVKKKQVTSYPFFAKISLNKIWFRFHLMITCIGATMTVVSLFKVLKASGVIV